MKIKIAIAEDNDFLAKSLIEKLALIPEKFSMNYRARNGLEMVDYLKTSNLPDVILMDIEMPVMNGIAATAQISEKFPDIKIIMLTVFDDEDKIFKAIKSGASGYLLKDESVEKIVDGIDSVLNGGAPMSAAIASKTLKLLKQSSNIITEKPTEDFNLSNREVEVLDLLKEGFDYNQIAEKLFISPFTVRKHIENIYKKLQVNNKMQAVQKATTNRII
ncbi:MAG TPA: response regulator transcription factor [Ignavibacteriaceae bacterium]|jgi:DNA-binding NarL/FixJ family response regulator|nr:MAG: Transcriptional regulatory protein DegU [Ignavibacteria bacterium ADurb.Bin266]OQY73081.1 MAG: DNA-binding response regulator [Ignavibacteriales bacterium UTCHB2]HQF42759.1 response regulator transcription factor [Ignavibacteriaceae bacterium]HQI40102.1 response regulator transcription factor [Ignavibacteriaceae bacterium]HQJ46512.1 response regulator transcription factor [Ignavibacteriaceae bacterium]